MRRHMQQTQQAGDSKEKILEMALKAFARYGFDGTTVRMICKEAKASPGLISYYWGGKEELWQEVCEKCNQKVSEIMAGAADFTLPPKKAVKLFFDKVFDAFLEEPELMRIVMWMILEAESIDFSRTRGGFQTALDFGKPYFQKHIDNGTFKKVDVDISLMTIRAMFVFMLSDRHSHIQSFGKDFSDAKHVARVKKSLLQSVMSILGLDE